MREEKKINGIEIGKEEIKLFLFTIVYVENTKKWQKKKRKKKDHKNSLNQ